MRHLPFAVRETINPAARKILRGDGALLSLFAISTSPNAYAQSVVPRPPFLQTHPARPWSKSTGLDRHEGIDNKRTGRSHTLSKSANERTLSLSQ